jgi:small neutral amino acid transporter SnatA (MarC family)
MDPIGALPLIFAWTANLETGERNRRLQDALLTAFTLGLVLILGGRWLLGVLGVGLPDFLVAGGLVLVALAITDLVVGGATKVAAARAVQISARCTHRQADSGGASDAGDNSGARR